MSKWQHISLMSAGTVTTGSTPAASDSTNYGGEVPFVTPADLGDLQPIIDAERSLSATGAQAARVVPSDSVLVCCIGATVGKTGIAGRQLATNQQINSITFKKDVILPRFGLHALRYMKSALQQMASATTMPIISKSRFEQVRIPVPPMAEQRRIAEVLDRADELRAKRCQTLAYLDDLTQSVFLDLLSCYNPNKVDWETSLQLGQVADISSGITKGRKTSEKSLRAIPYLAVVNVQDKRLELSSVKQIEATEQEIERYQICKNDLLLTEGGDPDKLGRGSLWNDELPEAIHQNHIFRVRITDPRRVNPVYLNYFVSSDRGKQYFLRSAKQTTGIASINMAQLRRFPLLLPPIEVQQEFARRVGAVQLLGATYRAGLRELDALFASLQDRAFRGLL